MYGRTVLCPYYRVTTAIGLRRVCDIINRTNHRAGVRGYLMEDCVYLWDASAATHHTFGFQTGLDKGIEVYFHLDNGAYAVYALFGSAKYAVDRSHIIGKLIPGFTHCRMEYDRDDYNG